LKGRRLTERHVLATCVCVRIRLIDCLLRIRFDLRRRIGCRLRLRYRFRRDILCGFDRSRPGNFAIAGVIGAEDCGQPNRDRNNENNDARNDSARRFSLATCDSESGY
jgi:hypothetical protein